MCQYLQSLSHTFTLAGSQLAAQRPPAGREHLNGPLKLLQSIFVISWTMCICSLDFLSIRSLHAASQLPANLNFESDFWYWPDLNYPVKTATINSFYIIIIYMCRCSLDFPSQLEAFVPPASCQPMWVYVKGVAGHGLTWTIPLKHNNTIFFISWTMCRCSNLDFPSQPEAFMLPASCQPMWVYAKGIAGIGLTWTKTTRINIFYIMNYV